MKKTSRTMAILLLMVSWNTGAWAKGIPTKVKPLTPEQISQIRALRQEMRSGKPAPHQVDGKAMRGAKKVSPDPQKTRP